VLQLRLLREAVRQLSLLPRGRAALLRRRLERAVYDEVCVLRVPYRSRRQVGGGPKQQLP